MVYYSFDFAADVAHLCMEEIRLRGLQERKIFRKSLPNNGLCIKVFKTKICTRDDLSCINIHSVATLMQDALWSTQERIISKKVWRTINYETCTLSRLSGFLTRQSEQLLLNILDFLLDVMQYKHINLMNAYKLGDALGKAVLGPSDCSPIMAEKAGHFLTRLLIEHAKFKKKSLSSKELRRIDSGIDYYSYIEHHPYCKSDGTQARARYYNRVILKTVSNSSDWSDNTIGVQNMLDDDYERTEPFEQPWVSIFAPTESLLSLDNTTSPVLCRILKEAARPVPQNPSDPFTASYLFNRSKMYKTERELQQAFTEFHTYTNNIVDLQDDKLRTFQKLNHSLSHLKLNIKKYRSRHDLLDESVIRYDTDVTVVDNEEKQTKNTVKNIMKKMKKMGADKEMKKTNLSPK